MFLSALPVIHALAIRFEVVDLALYEVALPDASGSVAQLLQLDARQCLKRSWKRSLPIVGAQHCDHPIQPVHRLRPIPVEKRYTAPPRIICRPWCPVSSSLTRHCTAARPRRIKLSSTANSRRSNAHAPNLSPSPPRLPSSSCSAASSVNAVQLRSAACEQCLERVTLSWIDAQPVFPLYPDHPVREPRAVAGRHPFGCVPRTLLRAVHRRIPQS